VTQGSTNPIKASPQEIAQRTVIAFSRTVVPSMPGIVFLSGG
jgi:fructose-bisphosphate aldolase class 1